MSFRSTVGSDTLADLSPATDSCGELTGTVGTVILGGGRLISPSAEVAMVSWLSRRRRLITVEMVVDPVSGLDGEAEMVSCNRNHVCMGSLLAPLLSCACSLSMMMYGLC